MQQFHKAILLIPIVLFVIEMFISVVQGEQLIPIIIEVVPELVLLASCGFLLSSCTI